MVPGAHNNEKGRKREGARSAHATNLKFKFSHGSRVTVFRHHANVGAFAR